MIFHEEYPQRFGCFAADTMIETNLCGSLWHGLQDDSERGAETSATALAFNPAMVEIDQSFRNRESEAKSAELSRYRRISLLERLEQRSEALRFDSDSCVDNFKIKTSRVVVKRADGNLSALGSEFHRVGNEIPEYLLKPDAIRQNVILLRLKLS